MEIKRHWLGQHWYLPGAAGNDINKVRTIPFARPHGGSATIDLQTNVPNLRLEYRRQTLVEELTMIRTARPAEVIVTAI